ncbi:peptidoglycan DD-metalloendopeptidase family protein [Thermus sp. 93170]|uniref:peptidoglycan DD-metalloendopeptidase family protein n=1 Tax=Thermus sp. 93170 TaxID=1046939 RepID=UPI003F43E7B0
MDRKVEISIEGRLRASVDEASVERAKRKAQEVEEAARKAGEGLSSLPEEVARAVEEAARRLEGAAGNLSRALEEVARKGLAPVEELRELYRRAAEGGRVRGLAPEAPAPGVEGPSRAEPPKPPPPPREGQPPLLLEGPEPPSPRRARVYPLEGAPSEVPQAPDPIALAYARALGLDHPLYRRVLRGLEGVEAQAAGARTLSDYARLESRLAVLDRYLEQALAQGADPKAAERLREEIAKLREALERERERRLAGGGGGGGAPPGAPPGGGVPPGGEGGGEGPGLPFGPWREMAQGLLRRAAQTGLSRFGPLGALLARLGPWGTALGAVGGVLFGADLAARYLEGLNREARGEATETADLARLLEYAGNPLAFFRQPGTLYPDRALLALGYTARDAQRIALAYGLPGGVQGDVRSILAFARTTGLGEEVAVRAARELGLLGIDRGQAAQALEVLKAAMAEGVREGVDKASTLQGLLRLTQEAASRGVQATPVGLAFQASLQAALAGTGNRLLQGEMGANAQAALKEAFSGLGDMGLQMFLVNALGGLPSARELGLTGAEARGYERLMRADPGRAMDIALRLLPERNPALWAKLVARAEAGLGTGLTAELLKSAGVQGEQLLTLLGVGVGSLAEEAARKAPAMRQDLLEDPQAKNRLAWESLQMDARKRAVEEANQLATLAATRGAEAALRDFTAALGGATAALKRAFGEDILAPGGSRRGHVEGVIRLPGGGQTGTGPQKEKQPTGPTGPLDIAREVYIYRALREMGVSEITLGVGEPYRPEVRDRFPQLPPQHQGLDVVYGDPRKPGDPVPSPFTGRVLRVGEDPKGYGRYVVLDVGGYEVLAGHLQEVKVRAGQVVRAGEILGLEGKTGAATGPHTHWEVRREGKAVTDRDTFFNIFYELMRRSREGPPSGEAAPPKQEVVVRIEGLDRIRVEGVSPPQAEQIRQGLALILQAAVPQNHRGG